MTQSTYLHFEHQVSTPLDAVAACLQDPRRVARCVPGAFLDRVDGHSATGRIRIKHSAVPTVYALRVELSRSADSEHHADIVVTARGHAEDQRTRTVSAFVVRVALTTSGPDRTACHITLELPDVTSDAVVDRLVRQFTGRLEDVAREHSDPFPIDSELATRADDSVATRLIRARGLAAPGAAGIGVAAVLLLALGRQLWRRPRRAAHS